MTVPSARDRFVTLVSAAFRDGTLVKLTLGKPVPERKDPTLRNLFVRPVTLKSGPHLSFVWRHATRDITKNHRPDEALAIVEPLLGRDFFDAHLFTPAQTAQYESSADGTARIRVKTASSAPAIPPERHDREKERLIPPDAGWLRQLRVTNEAGRPREGMASKLRQIEKFAELLQHLLIEAGLIADDNAWNPPETLSADPGQDSSPLNVVDMGCGKGYLTFATAALLGHRASVQGVEARPELVGLCNEVARSQGIPTLSFVPGEISTSALESGRSIDVLVALHACDTATDDALARGISAGARLLVVSPCCQKELRPQLVAPPVLAEALRHGIFRERQAEFVTDALRAQLLEWAGYRTKVFEFVSTEHTARNLMIAAIRSHPPGDSARLEHLRAFAAFYGIRKQRLAQHLDVALSKGS